MPRVSGKRHRLAQRRKAMGFSQERLAERLEVDRSTVARWENGETEPQPWARPRLAGALQITLQQLMDMLGVREFEALNSHLWRVFTLAKTKHHAYPFVREQLGVLVGALRNSPDGNVRRKLCALVSDLFQRVH